MGKSNYPQSLRNVPVPRMSTIKQGNAFDEVEVYEIEGWNGIYLVK